MAPPLHMCGYVRMCLWTYHTDSSSFRLFLHSSVHTARQRSRKKKDPTGPTNNLRPKEKYLTFPVQWESIHCVSPSLSPLPCATPTPPVPPSQQLSADCLGFCVPIRPIAVCLRQTQHLSYHCLDNSLLVQKSLQGLCSHDDDMVTLPGGSEPPAEIA